MGCLGLTAALRGVSRLETSAWLWEVQVSGRASLLLSRRSWQPWAGDRKPSSYLDAHLWLQGRDLCLKAKPPAPEQAENFLWRLASQKSYSQRCKWASDTTLKINTESQKAFLSLGKGKQEYLQQAVLFWKTTGTRSGYLPLGTTQQYEKQSGYIWQSSFIQLKQRFFFF